MKKIFFLLNLIILILTNPRWVKASNTIPTVSGISKSEAVTGEKISIYGSDLASEFEVISGNPPKACRYKLKAEIRLDKPELFPRIPFYSLPITSLTEKEATVTIPDIPSGRYEIYLLGKSDCNTMGVGSFYKINIKGRSTPIVSPSIQRQPSPLPSPSEELSSPSSSISEENKEENKLEDKQFISKDETSSSTILDRVKTLFQEVTLFLKRLIKLKR